MTTQRMAARAVSPAALSRVDLRQAGVYVGNIRRTAQPQPLALGELAGNQFTLRVRHAAGACARVRAAVDEVRASGFVNYFGEQRVGRWCVGNSGRMPHDAGAAMIRGDFKRAFALLMTGQGEHRAACAEAFRVLESTGEVGRAIKLLRQGCRVQTLMLRALQRYGREAYTEALRAIPHGHRTLFIHAYQSLVFNKIATLRLRLGCTPRAGDLVLAGKHMSARRGLLRVLGGAAEEGKAGAAGADVSLDREIGDFERECLPGGTDRGDDGVGAGVGEGGGGGAGIKVKIVTDCDVLEGRYTMADVVLALPGKNIIYPPLLQEEYARVLGDDGIDLADPAKRMAPFASGLVGSYRHVIAHPLALEMVSSSHEECGGGAESKKTSDESNTTRNENDKTSDESRHTSDGVGAENNQGSDQALLDAPPLEAVSVLKFRLTKGSYATCAVRELAKGCVAQGSHESLCDQ